MLTIGIDPDLHSLAVATWVDGKPGAASVVRVSQKLKGNDAVMAMLEALDAGALPDYEGSPRNIVVAVEGQELSRTGPAQHKRPVDIVRLGQVAGMAAAYCKFCLPGARILMPPPSVWKGSVPKAVMQARLYDELGLGYSMVGKGKPADYAAPYTSPAGFHHIKKAQWKHVGDALLLARWAAEQK